MFLIKIAFGCLIERLLCEQHPPVIFAPLCAEMHESPRETYIQRKTKLKLKFVIDIHTEILI